LLSFHLCYLQHLHEVKEKFLMIFLSRKVMIGLAEFPRDKSHFGPCKWILKAITYFTSRRATFLDTSYPLVRTDVEIKPPEMRTLSERQKKSYVVVMLRKDI